MWLLLAPFAIAAPPDIDLRKGDCPEGSRLHRTPTARLCVARGEGWRPRGPAVWWHDNGVLAQVGWHIDDHRHGHWQSWFENGQPESEGDWSMGRRTGAWATWRQDGTPASKRTYDVDGRLHGEDRTWYPTGQLREVASYDHGRRVGTWQFWDEAGRLRLHQVIDAMGHAEVIVASPCAPSSSSAR